MSGTRFWNQQRPRYVNGEPPSHLAAKNKIALVLQNRDYRTYLEYNLARCTPILHKGRWFNEWFVDGLSQRIGEYDQIVWQVDGGYHTASKIQKGRTKNRDDTLKEHCKKYDIRYVVFDSVEDVLNEYTTADIEKILGIG